MQNKPFFSIIIPALNEELYLPNLLESLTLQGYKDFEVIVVDGNSEDKTSDVAASFSLRLPSLTVISSKKRNVSFQRNLGAKAAKGQYFIFLDADIILPENYLEKLYPQTLGKTMFATTWAKAANRSKLFTSTFTAYNLILEAENKLNKPFSPGYNTIIHSSLFKKIRFRETYSILEDYDFSLRALEAGIELTILRNPQIIVSLRRFRSEGTFSTLAKYTFTNIYIMLKGPVNTKLFDYPMGGHVHGLNRKNKYEMLLPYVKTFEVTHKKIVNEVVKKAKKITKTSFYI